MKKIFILFILVVCTLTGCISGSNKKVEIYLPKLKTADSIFLYERFSSKLVSYNTKTFKIEQEPNVDNYVQYAFNSRSNYYTTGHSTTNGFEILKVEDRVLNHVYKLKDKGNQAIFPLATDGHRNLFILCYYKNGGFEIKRSIVEFDGKSKLTEFPNTNALISYGAILNETLYYTEYEENDETYSLYSLDISNYLNKPVLVEAKLSKGQLYVHNGKLYKSDQKSIYNDTDKYNRAFLNYFDDENNILLQIHENSQADSVLDVIDATTKNIIGSAISIIDFKIEGNEVIAYCQGHIDRIKLR